ncbi:alcohol dehydrogenase catalytic domain-containing protein [Brevibacterium sp. 5221]|uniref:alcohol dehydrogenase n=1 Tax=Brevibacterium rongguiense TaxID=2695267 RepID=A0A6N9H4G6_9MICO|nr:MULTISPECIES: NAD(P)-dependent alcohol dehydrogenase [Brevibacterium]MYM18572.1 alcohol dehydrogenase catalytic domain-containing protein [Brevibacterium rongguiense]WAL39646.1 NAD(P)-dependent alcohol dehydrogenase [Brevibacterium sp. BRM-1]
MRAVVFENYQTFPSLTDVEVPEPGAGEVLLKVAGAGACHSDVSVYRDFTAEHPGALKPSFVLGHESAGWVEKLGPGVTGVEIGDAYLVYGPTGCGRCRMCVQGAENYCDNAATNPALAIGLGRDGGMAEYVAVPARNLVPLGDADPVAAAPLADAGLTPYHAIKQALPNLAGGGKSALVVGLGGLGQVAVQILRALTGAQIIATDAKQEAMDAVAGDGVETVPAGDGQVERIRDLTGGRGVDAAFDFVGAKATIATARAAAGIGSRVVVVGIADGTADWSFFGTPYESTLNGTYWGSLGDLYDVAAMYRRGQITPTIQTFAMDDALEAYRSLEAGKISGRAVVTPNA